MIEEISLYKYNRFFLRPPLNVSIVKVTCLNLKDPGLLPNERTRAWDFISKKSHVIFTNWDVFALFWPP